MKAHKLLNKYSTGSGEPFSYHGSLLAGRKKKKKKIEYHVHRYQRYIKRKIMNVKYAAVGKKSCGLGKKSVSSRFFKGYRDR